MQWEIEDIILNTFKYLNIWIETWLPTGLSQYHNIQCLLPVAKSMKMTKVEYIWTKSTKMMVKQQDHGWNMAEYRKYKLLHDCSCGSCPESLHNYWFFFFLHLKGTEKHEIYLFCRSTQNIYRNKHLKQQIITYLFKKLLVNENIYERVFFHY